MINVYKLIYDGIISIKEEKIFSIPNANIQDFDIHSELKYGDKLYLILKKRFVIDEFGLKETKLLVIDITDE